MEALAVGVWWESCCFFRNLEIKFMAGARKGGTERWSLRGSVFVGGDCLCGAARGGE